MGKIPDKILSNLLNKIYSGKVNPRNLPKDLYSATAEYLKDGLFTGFKNDVTKATKKISKAAKGLGAGDRELMEELRQNIYMFSAAKTYQQVRELSALLVDSDGVLRSRNDFKRDAMAVVKRYNDAWLNTEYETAIGQGQNAMKWSNIVAQSDILPILQYVTVGQEHACEICRPLDGITAPWNHPIWRKIMPLNHFRCMCLVKQLQKGEARVTASNVIDRAFKNAMDKMDDIFKMNPGIDGYAFSPKHPYFTVPKADKDFARKNFGLPIPKK